MEAKDTHHENANGIFSPSLQVEAPIMHISEKSLNLIVAGFQHETNTCDRSQFTESVDIIHSNILCPWEESWAQING